VRKYGQNIVVLIVAKSTNIANAIYAQNVVVVIVFVLTMMVNRPNMTSGRIFTVVTIGTKDNLTITKPPL